MDGIKKITLVKLFTAIFIVAALFFSYQLPAGSIQKSVKISCLALSLFFMVIIIKNTNDSKKNWLNILLFAVISITMVLYFFE